MRSLRRTLPILALALAPLAGWAQDAAPPPDGPARTITVTGAGQADEAPDLAIVSLGVSEQAATAGTAMAAMASGMTEVLATLAEAGIASADVRTAQFTLEAAYNYDSGSAYPPVTGYIATQTVDVRVRDVGAVGPLLDRAMAGGANRVNAVQFLLDDQASALAEARTAAVADARARAAFYAEAAGVALGPILRIAEGGASGGPQPMFDQRFAADAAVPVAPGQVSVGANVTLTFAIE